VSRRDRALDGEGPLRGGRQDYIITAQLPEINPLRPDDPERDSSRRCGGIGQWARGKKSCNPECRSGNAKSRTRRWCIFEFETWDSWVHQ